MNLYLGRGMGAAPLGVSADGRICNGYTDPTCIPVTDPNWGSEAQAEALMLEQMRKREEAARKAALYAAQGYTPTPKPAINLVPQSVPQTTETVSGANPWPLIGVGVAALALLYFYSTRRGG